MNCQYHFKLYVIESTPFSVTAIENFTKILNEYLRKDQYKLDIIDVVDNPTSALQDSIVVTPTLIRSIPEPIKRIVGNLSNKIEIVQELELI